VSLIRVAHFFSHLIQSHEVGRLLDEAMSEDDIRELQEAEEVCRRFLAIDLIAAERRKEVIASGVKDMLEGVLGLADDSEDIAEPISP
jgi:DNA mismatch repair protein MSH5